MHRYAKCLALALLCCSMAHAEDRAGLQIREQIERLSLLLAEPGISAEDESLRIVQKLDRRGAELFAVVMTFSAVGGTGFSQTLALLEGQFVPANQVVLRGLLYQAGGKGVRFITRVRPKVYPASENKRRHPFFEVEAEDQDSESANFRQTVRVRFEFETAAFVSEVASNPSIERTSASRLRRLAAAAHVER